MAARQLRIRMYNVGFGDCFLLTLPGKPKRTVLVDAGFHSQGKGAFSGKELAEQVLGDVEEAVGRKRVDVVIATHRHQDHVTTFNAGEWDELEVGEVWMPWVEDRDNGAAVKLWKTKQKFAAMLSDSLPGFHLDEATRNEVEFLLWNAGVGATPGEGFAAWSNAGALDRLHEGFAKRDREKPRFLPAGEAYPESFETDVLPGVKVHVLGPPRDPDLIAELDPRSDGETYRALALRAAESTGRPLPSPFADVWNAGEPTPAEAPLSPKESERLGDLARGLDPLFAAQALDGMINSTSLVLVMEIGKARLLLPGDAEWGTWKVILGDQRARSLVKGTTFLKVGHHGSHNATPRTLVEEVLRAGVRAMISTQEGEGSYRNDIPLAALLTAFEEKGIDAVRSDDATGKLPKGFARGVEDRWIDLSLPC